MTTLPNWTEAGRQRAARLCTVALLHAALLALVLQADGVRQFAIPPAPAMQAVLLRLGSAGGGTAVPPLASTAPDAAPHGPAPQAAPLPGASAADTLAPLLVKPLPMPLAPTPPAPSAVPAARPAPAADAVPGTTAPQAPAASPQASTPVSDGAAGSKPVENKFIRIVEMNAGSASYVISAFGDAVYQVERGSYRSIELAIANDIIERIRTRFPSAILWKSQSTGEVMRLSMLAEDQPEAAAYLRDEIFPNAADQRRQFIEAPYVPSKDHYRPRPPREPLNNRPPPPATPKK